jgi:hypothetical protein|nr:MAG TPA: hypothetical protein [Caudoviricetes sp.]
MSCKCAFKSVQVLPAYGKNICRIVWALCAEYYDFTKFGINVYKSRDGYTDWFKLTDVAVDPETGMITDISSGQPVYLNRDKGSAVVNINNSRTSVDINFKNRNQTFNWHYKCALYDKSKGQEIDTSPPVGIYNTLTSEQFASLRQMIKSDLLSTDYNDFYICRPKGNRGRVINPNEKDISLNIDILGGDQLGLITDDVSLGKLYEGGYSNPIKTKLVINSVKHEHIDDQNGQGTLDPVTVSITGIYYPKLIVGDLIVNKTTDDRYLFEGYTEEFYFMGKVPYKFNGVMRLVPRNQPEYKFDISNIKPCLDQ